MPTLREFFATEAAEFLSELNRVVQRLDGGSGNAADLQKHSRSLRGSAQMAREDRVYRAALGLEAVARAVTAGAVSWSDAISSRVRMALEDLDTLVRGNEPDDAADARVRRALDRWKEVGLNLPEPGAPQNTQQVSEASRQFRQFAAHEVSGIIAELDTNIERLVAEPRNRDPLKNILRRQRAMLGSARLGELPVVAEALRGTEDLTRVIAKLNVPVKEEWLQVFRAARDVLKSALESLQRGEVPGPTPALSKLRVLRQELLDRYGEGEAVPVMGAAPQQGIYTPPPAANAPEPVSATSAPDGDELVSIEQLQYTGPKALQRALELRPELEKFLTDAAARERLDEVFDLIRLGTA